jgi:hypothetical protein
MTAQQAGWICAHAERLILQGYETQTVLMMVFILLGGTPLVSVKTGGVSGNRGRNLAGIKL